MFDSKNMVIEVVIEWDLWGFEWEKLNTSSSSMVASNKQRARTRNSPNPIRSACILGVSPSNPVARWEIPVACNTTRDRMRYRRLISSNNLYRGKHLISYNILDDIIIAYRGFLCFFSCLRRTCCYH